MRRDERGFTLMEMMVVIVIVAILAAVAVPLYINYVKDAQRTDAKAAIGAIITAQQAFYLKNPPGEVPTYADNLGELVTKKVLDPAFVAEIQKRWTVNPNMKDGEGFEVVLTGKGVEVKYTYSPTTGGEWTDTEGSTGGGGSGGGAGL